MPRRLRRRSNAEPGPSLLPPRLGRAVAAAAFFLSASRDRGGDGDASGIPAALAFVPLGRRGPSRPSWRPRCRPGPRGTTSASAPRMSSIGGEDDLGGDGGDGGDNPLNEWMSRKDSENVRQVREQFAEGRLPISYGAMNADDEEGGGDPQQFGPLRDDDRGAASDGGDAVDAASAAPSPSSSLARGRPNPYLSVVSRLAPSDLIAKFTATASPRVQDAVRTTVLGLIGGLPQMAFETKTVATGERLASLMFQLQMTGYMFKNAEYRLTLSQSLGRERMLPGSGGDDDAKAVREGRGRLRGKIKVRYGGGNGSDAMVDADEGAEESREDGESNRQKEVSSVSSPGMEVEVDAQAYMSELRGEVSRLRDELDATKQAKEEEIRKDLL